MSEKMVYRVGGLSGVIAGVFLLYAWGSFASTLWGDLPGLTNFVRYPQNTESDRIIFSVNASVLFAYFVLLLPFYFALYKRLKETAPGSFRFGIFLGITAAVLFAAITAMASSLVHTLSLYDYCFRPPPYCVGFSDFDADFTLTAILSLSGALIDVESGLQGIALIVIGAAMVRTGSPTMFRGWYGWISMVLGVLVISLTLVSPFNAIVWLGALKVEITTWEWEQILVVPWLVLIGTRLFFQPRTPKTSIAAAQS